jgi:hypothetical protein
VPGTVTVGFCCVEVKPFGPVQRKVTSSVGEDPSNVTTLFVQVIIPETEAAAPGGMVSDVTVTVAVEEQPFAGLVTVSV